MRSPSSTLAAPPPRTRAVERLAKKLYERSESSDKPWIRLGWDVRENWLNEAARSLEPADASRDRSYLWRLFRTPS